MSVYTYVGRDRDGRRQRGWIEADTPKNARVTLSERGLLTESLTPGAATGKVSGAARAQLYRELGVLLLAGFNLERALGLLMEEGRSDVAMGCFLAGLRDRVREGLTLSAAMAELVSRLPVFERAALQAAEQAGLAGQLLEQLADFIEGQRTVNERLRSALIYPAAVFTMAMGLLSLMMFVVLPRATRLFARFGDDLPAGTRFVAAWGPRVLLLLMLSLLLGGLWLWRARRLARRNPARAVQLEQLAFQAKLPARVLGQLWSMRFAATMALLIRSGVTPQDAVAMAGAATGSVWLAQLTAAQAEKVRHGLSLSSAVAALPPLAPHLAEWVRVGESSGNLQGMLTQAAQRCRQAYETRLTRLMGLLEPTLILAVGLAVLLVAWTVLKPVLDLARAAANV